MPDGADSGRGESLTSASARVDRALLDLGAVGRVQQSVIEDATRQVAACAAALRTGAASWSVPGDLPPPPGTNGLPR